MHTTKRIKTKHGDFNVLIEIDFDGMANYLAAQAARNKTRRSRMAFAKAKATPITIVKPKPIPEEEKQALSDANKALNAAFFGR